MVGSFDDVEVVFDYQYCIPLIDQPLQNIKQFLNIRADMTADSRLQMEKELRELSRSVSRRKEDLRDELSFRRTEEVQQLEDQINIAVQEIARRNGYDLILSSPVIFASPHLDITNLILEQLEVEFAADQLELGIR